MVICIVALVIFGFLSLFSAKYRPLAKETFNCVFRMVTLRPCQSSFDERVKGTLVAKTLAFSPKLAKFINQQFQLLSAMFTILFFASLFFSAQAVYNYVAFGNCNGPNSTAFCAIDALFHPTGNTGFTPPLPGNGPKLGNGTETLIEFGCFTCPYTKIAQKPLKEFLALHRELTLEFRAFPIPTHPYSKEAAEAAFCAKDQGKFWNYSDLLFANQDKLNESELFVLAQQISLNMTKFTSCYSSGKYVDLVNKDIQDGNNAGVYGTPTYFLGNTTLIGPVTETDFEKVLNGKSVVDASEGAACTAPLKAKLNSTS